MHAVRDELGMVPFEAGQLPLQALLGWPIQHDGVGQVIGPDQYSSSLVLASYPILSSSENYMMSIGH